MPDYGVDYDYMKRQLDILTEEHYDEPNIKVKFTSDIGVTNWLNVRPEVFEKVKAILIEGEKP